MCENWALLRRLLLAPAQQPAQRILQLLLLRRLRRWLPSLLARLLFSSQE